MAQASYSVTITRPIEEVFAFIADGERSHEWRPGVVDIHRLSGEGVGSTYAQGVSGPMGRRVAADYEVTVFQPSTRLEFQTTTGPARPHGRYHLAAVAGGTHLTFSLDAQLGGLRNLLMGQWFRRRWIPRSTISTMPNGFSRRHPGRQRHRRSSRRIELAAGESPLVCGHLTDADPGSTRPRAPRSACGGISSSVAANPKTRRMASRAIAASPGSSRDILMGASDRRRMRTRTPPPTGATEIARMISRPMESESPSVAAQPGRCVESHSTSIRPRASCPTERRGGSPSPGASRYRPAS
jgi:hypothetical protein